MDKGSEDHWKQLSEEILFDMNEWRRGHPKATLYEIEEEVHSRMSRLEAHMIEATAHQSDQRTWTRKEAHDRPRCPVCQTPLQARGKHKRVLQAGGGQPVTLERTYGVCPSCGTGLFPPR